MSPNRDVLLRLLARAPMWTRTRWPLRRFYWQAEQIESIEREVAEMKAMFDAQR